METRNGDLGNGFQETAKDTTDSLIRNGHILSGIVQMPFYHLEGRQTLPRVNLIGSLGF